MPKFFIRISPTPIFLFPFVDKKKTLFHKVQKDWPENFGLRTMLGDKKNGCHIGIISER